MVKSSSAPMPTTPSSGGTDATSNQDNAQYRRNMFFVMGMNMSWQLAIVVLVPIIGGVQLDEALDTSHLFLFVGLALALIGSTVVMWRTMQAANRLPVPKLTDEQRAAVKKSYDEDDE